MKKFITVGILGLLLLGALGVVITGTALAQEDTPQPEIGHRSRVSRWLRPRLR